jgi:hypothetical protein
MADLEKAKAYCENSNITLYDFLCGNLDLYTPQEIHDLLNSPEIKKKFT